MKIENYEVTVNTFTFPFNSVVFDDTTPVGNRQVTVPFDNKHIFMSSGSLNPKNLSIQGYFSGANKDDNYANLLEHASSPNLKKFYFADDKFYLVFSPSFKKTQTGGRTNFLDYIGSFITPIPFIFSDTQKTASYNGSWTGGTQTNAGKHKTFIEEIDVTLSGGSAGDILTINDSNIGGMTLTLPTYTNGQILNIKLITMVDSKGIFITEYWYATIGSTKIQRSLSIGNSRLDLELRPTEQIDTFSFSGTAIYSNIELKWRDSYLN